MNHFSGYRNEGEEAGSAGEAVSQGFIRKSVGLVAATAELSWSSTWARPPGRLGGPTTRLHGFETANVQ